MRKIKLGITNKYITLVDDEDFKWLSQYTWFFDKSNGYVKRSTYEPEIGRIAHVYMHRQILQVHGAVFHGNQQVDHINMNKLDNRKSNLRVVLPVNNYINRGKNSNNKSGYKGVYLAEKKYKLKPWRAQIKVNRKGLYLGTFYTKEEAALAYNKAAKKYFGNFARLNIVK